MDWQPIETAPKDGSRVLCWAPGWEPCFLIWKLNPRITDIGSLVKNTRTGPEWHKRYLAVLEKHPQAYFGDPNEMDDYELAEPGNGPTHWLPLPKPPAAKALEQG